MRIAIIGAGTLGRGWLISFARSGARVRFFDPDPAAAGKVEEFLSDRLPALARHGLIEDAAAVRSRIQGLKSLEDAVADADYVQESVPERVDLKRSVFKTLDLAAPPSAILASSTTGIPPTSFVEGLPGRERCIAVHPLNPPYLQPAVEITPSPWTSEACAARTKALMEEIGQVPIMLRGEGRLVLTRLAAAILTEAFRLVEDGSASVEDVDKAIRDGLGLRYAFMGPFEVADLNAPRGIADFVRRYGATFTDLRKAREGQATDWPAELVARIDAERRAILPLAEIGGRMAWRDERLMEIAAYKRSLAKRPP
jgi:3-hydroxyacyl-CoA dehydrogenase